MVEAGRNGGFETTEGLHLLWELAGQPENIVLRALDGELDGMEYYESEYRWPAVHGSNGSVTVTVPRAGEFYVGVVVYERTEPDAELSFEMSLDDEVVGSFFPCESDNRQRLYSLTRPLSFEGGERITVRTGDKGFHLIEDIMLLRMKPPVRKRRLEIGNFEAALSRREAEDALRLTWITTWPAACRIEYEAGGQTRTVEEELALANHRVHLTGLEPGATYRCRIVAPTPNGGEVRSEEVVVPFAAPDVFTGGVERATVPLSVENPYDFAVDGYPVTSGIPFAEGELGSAENVRLLDVDGKPVTIQAKVTGRWRDGSAKWVLLSFCADVSADTTAQYTLEYGSGVSRENATTPLDVRQDGDRVSVRTGPLEVEFDAGRSGFPVGVHLDGQDVFDEPIEAGIVAGNGVEYGSGGPAEHIGVEEAGPVRAVVHSRGHHRSDNGEAFFAYEARFVFTSGSPFFRVYYAWGNDEAELFSHFKSIALRVPIGEGQSSEWAVGLGEAGQGKGEGEMALRQLKHDAFELDGGADGDGPLHRADGWLDVRSGDAGLMVAVRDFWQLYPKALGIGPAGVEVALSPCFPSDTYAGATEREATNYYYYLQDGQYKIKRGVKKWHEVMLLFHRGTPAEPDHVQMATLFDEPLIATCPPERYCDTQVFGPLIPAATGKIDDYDRIIEEFVELYEADCEERTWYGMMNFGDRLGEADTATWLNGEYDFHHGFLLEFARKADRRLYFLAEKAARHCIDVDACHYGPDVGVVWAHALGHTGDYFEWDPLNGNSHPQGFWTPSHTWTEGFTDWHFLSGDPTAQEAARFVADYYSGDHLNNYDFYNCRDSGWCVILIIAVYKATGDPYYLNAANIIVERVLERQTPGPRGWQRQMVPAHCYCTPRHRGANIYMVAILCRGLESYYEATGDERVADAIVGGADQLVDEMWVDEEEFERLYGLMAKEGDGEAVDRMWTKTGNAKAFRPTSCPARRSDPWYSYPSQMLLFAHWRAGRPEYVDIAGEMRGRLRANAHWLTLTPWWLKALYYLEAAKTKAPETE